MTPWFPVFEFTEGVEIDTSVDRSWTYLIDVDRWWTASNPVHESREILDEGGTLDVGTRIRIREKVAGIAPGSGPQPALRRPRRPR